MNEHSSKQYTLDLEAIRSKVLAMGGLIEEQFKDAKNALVSGDLLEAEKVIKKDAEINQLEIELDKACTQLIVKRQPAANDLRTVMATVKIITDLERIGDEITKIARSARNAKIYTTQIISQHQPVKVIAEYAARMLNDALNAFARMDRDLAIRLIGYDDVIDHEFHEWMRRLVAYMEENPHTIPAALDLLWAVKAMERIGDHSTNIAEYVIYVIEGNDIRHKKFETQFTERPI